MPQMSPSFWTLIYFLTIFSLYMIMSIIYYFMIYPMKNKILKKKTMYKNKWTWMW